MLEEGRRDRNEREDRNIERHAHEDNQPVAEWEVADIADRNLLLLCECLACLALATKVQECQAQAGSYGNEAQSCSKPEECGHAKALIDGGRHQEVDCRADAAEAQRNSECEVQLLSAEPLREVGALRHREGLASEAKHKPTDEANVVRRCRVGGQEDRAARPDELSDEDEAAEEHAAQADAEHAVDDPSAAEWQDDVGQAVDAVVERVLQL
mmetsp:Transcript_15817/g.61811  ORF Transcript_15817/g.61811 Transcript_15817/m.61811 type:complete len:212 (-) Transcript_15817:291-926(-)